MLEQDAAHPTRVVRWGILGTAHIAQVALIPAIQQSRNGVVAAIASRDPIQAEVVAQVYGIPRTYGSYAELLDDPDLDAIYIPLPNHLHAEWTIRALQAGKHVLCEKPLALNAAQAQHMVATARVHERLLMEAFMYRFHPRSQEIHALVQQGALGHVLLARASFSFRHTRPHDYRLDPAMGGGALLDVGCYGVNVLRWMLNAEPEVVHAYTVYGETGIDVTTVGMLRFPDGRIATVEASFATAVQQSLALIGTSATIEVPQAAFAPGTAPASYLWRGADARASSNVTLDGVDEYQLMVEHFGDAVLGDAELAYPPEDSICTMRVLDALAESALAEAPIAVPMQPCDTLAVADAVAAVA